MGMYKNIGYKYQFIKFKPTMSIYLKSQLKMNNRYSKSKQKITYDLSYQVCLIILTKNISLSCTFVMINEDKS